MGHSLGIGFLGCVAGVVLYLGVAGYFQAQSNEDDIRFNESSVCSLLVSLQAELNDRTDPLRRAEAGDARVLREQAKWRNNPERSEFLRDEANRKVDLIDAYNRIEERDPCAA